MRDVVIYGNVVLRAKSEPVRKVDDALRKLAKEMLTAMYRLNGAGLAAQQIGRKEAMCVIDVSPREHAESPGVSPENPNVPMPLVMLNPRITEATGEQRESEGCLSFPEVFVSLKRAAEVTCVFTDLSGREQTVKGVGLLARAIQHELDHLNGVLIVDHMSMAQKLAVAGKLKRLKKQAQEDAA